MGLREDLLTCVALAAVEGLPPIARVFLPEPRPDPARDAEFGMLELADGSCGLYYAWLGESQRGMAARWTANQLFGADPIGIAAGYLSDDEAERSLALAAINAITAHVWRRAGVVAPVARSSFGLALTAGDRLGMVGYFPPLVRRAIAMGAEVTVIERKAHLLGRERKARITLDLEALHECNKVICSAATLINLSLSEILEHCGRATEIALLGPTAGCFPEPLFARGITTIGGTRIIDSTLALDRLRRGVKLGDAAVRFELTPATAWTLAKPI
ncbi:MAG: Rossmann-like domain-containing protein [Gammaproteobacteria bacterium]